MHLGENIRSKLHVPDVVALNPKPQIRTANRKGVSLVRFNSFWIRRRRRQSPEITVTFAYGDSLFMRRSSKLITESIICSQASTSSLRRQLMKQVTYLCQVLKHQMRTRLPDSLVKKRWTKEASVRRTLLSSGLANDNVVQLARYGDLMSACAKFCHFASFSGEGYEETKEVLSQLTIRAQKYRVPNQCL